jgi:signal transduction histidine kinase
MKSEGRLAQRLRDVPIRRKLTLISALTTVIALTIAGLGMLAADTFLSYRYLQNDLATFAAVVGNNSTAALAFDDPKVATETLAALKPRSHVQIACLFQTTGAKLASYVRPGFTGICPNPSSEEVRMAGLTLIATERIQLAERNVGTLVLQYDLGEIFERVAVFAAIVLAGLLLSYIATISLSSRLRAIIARPILELADIAHEITRSNDYSIRAARASQDETGVLANAINTMMEAVQDRDRELRKSLEQQQVAFAQMAKLNAELQRSNGDLERSNTDLERFAFMASHDLQEPLRMITTYSQMLVARRESGDKAQLDQFANYVAGGTARMRELLADLLAYSEIAGSVDREAEVVDIKAVIDDALQLLKARLEESGAHVFVGEMPLLRAHHNRIASLFQNLIENAIKYRSEAPPEIRISAACDAKEFTFTVADNGIGLQREDYSKIFIAFHRLHGKEIPGTGIGLAICKRVVERYGGRIWVESEPGQGSSFLFTLPASMAGTRERAHDHRT